MEPKDTCLKATLGATKPRVQANVLSLDLIPHRASMPPTSAFRGPASCRPVVKPEPQQATDPSLVKPHTAWVPISPAPTVRLVRGSAGILNQDGSEIGQQV